MINTPDSSQCYTSLSDGGGAGEERSNRGVEDDELPEISGLGDAKAVMEEFETEICIYCCVQRLHV